MGVVLSGAINAADPIGWIYIYTRWWRPASTKLCYVVGTFAYDKVIILTEYLKKNVYLHNQNWIIDWQNVETWWCVVRHRGRGGLAPPGPGRASSSHLLDVWAPALRTSLSTSRYTTLRVWTPSSPSNRPCVGPSAIRQRTPLLSFGGNPQREKATYSCP